MGSPVSAIGYGVRAGFGLCDPDDGWLVARALAANEQLEYGQESLAVDINLIPDTQINGSPTPGFGSKGIAKFDGAISDIALQYASKPLLSMIAAVMGTAGAPTEITPGKSYKHILDLAPDNAGLFGTLAFDKAVAVHEFGNFKPMGFTISMKSNEDVKVAVSGVAGKLVLDSAVNPSGLASVTLPAIRKIATFGHARLFINEFDDGALDVDGDSADAIPFTEFSAAFERPHDADYPSESYPYSREPVSNGFLTPGGSLNFPVYATENAAIFQGQIDKTLYKAMLVLEHEDVISTSTDKYKIIIYIPALQLATGSPNVGGPGKVPLNLTWRAAHVGTPGTGFTAGDISIEVHNEISTDLLAHP